MFTRCSAAFQSLAAALRKNHFILSHTEKEKETDRLPRVNLTGQYNVQPTTATLKKHQLSLSTRCLTQSL